MKDPVYTVTKNADDETYTIHMEGENLVKFDDKITVSILEIFTFERIN